MCNCQVTRNCENFLVYAVKHYQLTSENVDLYVQHSVTNILKLKCESCGTHGISRPVAQDESRAGGGG
jgi:hypothetical protein